MISGLLHDARTSEGQDAAVRVSVCVCVSVYMSFCS